MSAPAGGVPEFLTWTSPAEIVSALYRRWTRGELLEALVTGEALFPLAIPLRRPRALSAERRPDEVQRWIQMLEQRSRSHLGFGYEIQWTTVQHGGTGAVRLPASVVVPSAGDAFRLIGRGAEAERFEGLARRTLKVCPELRGWLRKHPLRAVKSARQWDRILTLVVWFQAHARPRLYLRQIDIPAIDMGFIQQQRGLIAELLDEALPPEAIDRQASPVRGFEQRYGLRSPPALIRVRLVDPHQAAAGFTDVSVPVPELAASPPLASRIFVVANELNGLAFPERRDSAIIFSHAGDDPRLAALPWLREKEVYFWSDIGTRELAALDHLRATFPRLRSFLMDRETLLAHRRSWVTDGGPSEALRALDRLTGEERSLYEDLAANRLGASVRLDQEQVSYRWLTRKLDALPPVPRSSSSKDQLATPTHFDRGFDQVEPSGRGPSSGCP